MAGDPDFYAAALAGLKAGAPGMPENSRQAIARNISLRCKAALRSTGTGRSEAEVTIPAADYRRLIEASECDDTIVRCGTCGAWLHMDEAAVTDDFTGCPKLAYESGDESTCRSYRATVLEGLAAIRTIPAQAAGGGDA